MDMPIAKYFPIHVCFLRLGDDDFPKDFGMMKVTLRDLNLSGNNLTTLPLSLLGLSGLRNLFIGANRLLRLPRGINQLKRLKVFYLGGNCLRQLPEEIGQLSHLVALILSDNLLDCLPDSLSDLKKLQCLQIHKNRFTTGYFFLLTFELENTYLVRKD